MPNFDLRTVVLMFTLVCLLMSVILYSASRNYPSYIGGLREWAAGSLAISTGSLLVGLRGIAPDLVSIILGNLFFYASSLFFMEGTRRFYKLSSIHKIWLVLFVAVQLLMLVFTYGYSSITVRTLLFTSASGLYISRSIFYAWKYGSRDFPTLFFIASLSAVCLLLAIRFCAAFYTLIALPQEGNNAYFSHSPIQTLYIVGMALLDMLGPMAFFLMATHELRIRLQELSNTDPLTGLLNRRALSTHTNLEIAKAKRSEQTISMLMIDLDLFKQINDQFGHDVGDKVLVHFSGVVRELCREIDYLARSGGEEFILILPATPIEDANSVAQRIQQALSNNRNSGLPGYTCSIGVATQNDVHESFDALLKRADRAMYRAKESGRNRIEIASSSARP
ncbi:GGDEF domain-containing protein [Undibacterium sp. SXout11W]|uniref:GGDEF domain-containing protein n=1 Tax=Undibacterium sp. SXout11W TaxID=3413050 RepID=UPI003BF1EC65